MLTSGEGFQTKQDISSDAKRSYLALTKDSKGNFKIDIVKNLTERTLFQAIADNIHSKEKGSLGDQLAKADARDVVDLLGIVATQKGKLDNQYETKISQTTKFFASLGFANLATGIKKEISYWEKVEADVKERIKSLGGETKSSELAKAVDSKEGAKAKNVENQDKLKKLREERKGFDKKKVVVDGKELARKEKNTKRKALEGQIKTLLAEIKTYEKANDRKALKKTNSDEIKAKKSEKRRLESRKKDFDAKISKPGIKD